jgi:hypothetical protein
VYSIASSISIASNVSERANIKSDERLEVDKFCVCAIKWCFCSSRFGSKLRQARRPRAIYGRVGELEKSETDVKKVI